MAEYTPSLQQVRDALLQAENDLIEADLLALGATMEKASEWEVIYQHHDGRTVYRGIRRGGVVVWDRHPDWPMIADCASPDHICPECRAGKHRNCDGTAWCNTLDDQVACVCDHTPSATAPKGHE